MKKISLSAIIVSALLLSNCSNEEMMERIPIGNAVISATIEDGKDTRSNVDDKGFFTWTKGDAIAVYTTNESSRWTKFTLQGEGGTATGNFSGSYVGEGTTSTTCAVYPYNEGKHSLSGSTLTFHMPNTYNYENGNTHAPMLALISKGSTDFPFKHLGGVIRFKINNIPANTTQFVFTTPGQKITGDFTVTDINAPEAEISTSQSSVDNTVTIKLESSATPSNKTIYIPMPAGTYSSMKIEMKNESGKVLNESSTAKSNTIQRRGLLLMPTLTCADVEGSIMGSATDVSSLNTLLSNASDAGKLSSVTLSGDGVKNISEAITIPQTYTNTSGDAKVLNLVFDDVPAPSTSGNAIEIKDVNSSASVTEQSKTKVELAIPNVANGETAPSFDITLPTATVTISATGESATYNEVTATTAKQTLIINKGVTVKKLTIKGGNVEIRGKVNELVVDSENATTTSVEVTGEGVCLTYNFNNKEIAYKNTWDGKSKAAPAETGKIYSAAELAYFQSASANIQTTATSLPVTMDADYVLQNDIDLGGHPWLGIVLGQSKTFDGNGKSISNLSMVEPVLYETGNHTHPACIGLFAAAYTNSTIKGITLKGVRVGTEAGNVGCKWTGSLVGYSQAGTYTGCKAEDVKLYCNTNLGYYSSYRVGGLIGFISAGNPTLTNCEVNGATIVANFGYGGLVGSVMTASTTFNACKTSNITLLPGNCYNNDLGTVSKFIGDVELAGGTRSITIENNSSSDALTSDEKDALHFYMITKKEGNEVLTYTDGNQYTGRISAAQLTLTVNGTQLTNGTDYNKYEKAPYTPGSLPQYNNNGTTGWDK